MMKKTAWLLMTLLLAAILVLSACGGDTEDTTGSTEPAFVSPHTTPERAALARSEEPTYGGRLKMMGYDSTGWDPITTGMAEFSEPVFSRLLMFDWWKGPAGTGEWSFTYPGAMPPTNIFMGDLAESWEMLSETSIVYTLKKGVMWQDKPGVMAAREIVADDIIYNYQRMIDTPTHRLGNKYSDQTMTEMIAVDDYTIEFHYSTPSYWYPVLYIGQMYDMVPPEVIEEFGDLTDWRHVTGSGPFALTDYISGSVISYDANPNWHITDPDGGRLPYIAGLDVLIIIDASTALTALRSGQIDLISGYSNVSWGDAESLWETNPELSWVEKGSGTPVKLVFDMKGPPFGPSDSEDARKIRRALSMAVDREGMVEG
ncbi:MAG: ABC transporter substrate-binding protein, partial [Candidatus Bathyanammoxibius sp.]